MLAPFDADQELPLAAIGMRKGHHTPATSPNPSLLGSCRYEFTNRLCAEKAHASQTRATVVLVSALRLAQEKEAQTQSAGTVMDDAITDAVQATRSCARRETSPLLNSVQHPARLPEVIYGTR